MQLLLTLFILMKFAMHVDRISMEMPIWYLIINISYPSFQENWSRISDQFLSYVFLIKHISRQEHDSVIMTHASVDHYIFIFLNIKQDSSVKDS